MLRPKFVHTSPFRALQSLNEEKIITEMKDRFVVKWVSLKLPGYKAWF